MKRGARSSGRAAAKAGLWRSVWPAARTTPDDFASFLDQVVRLVKNTGSSYASSDLVFGAGHPGEPGGADGDDDPAADASDSEVGENGDDDADDDRDADDRDEESRAQ